MFDNMRAMKMNSEHQRREANAMVTIAIAVIGGQSDVEFVNTIIDNSHVLGVTRKRCNPLRERRGNNSHLLHKQQRVLL
jgi:hypothetical protein